MFDRRRRLAAKHQKLEAAIAEEMARQHPDRLRLQALKRRKLRIKDELRASEGLLATLCRPGPPATA